MASPSRYVAEETLVELLQMRAERTPDRLGQRFLLNGEDQVQELTYGGLDVRARRIAAALQAHGCAGERALLLFPPGLDYVAAFFGSLYAGAVAVPAYPPDPSPARLRRTLPRLQAIVADSGARFVLTTRAIASMAKMLFTMAPELEQLTWVATDVLDEGEGAWENPGATADSLAFLQYTSGSTGRPRGVMLSHGNLLTNLACVTEKFEHTSDSSAIIWLPPYHDMGLIGGVLEPLHGGFPTTLMSPISFLRKPMRWLKAISAYKATTSGGPNFAFELCIRKCSEADLEGLDLSRWDVAFTGAEPIRASTVRAFTEKFACVGFTPEAFYPCYGLAEATLIASGGLKALPPVLSEVLPGPLERGHAVDAADTGERSRALVSCGSAAIDHDFRIVDPATHDPRPDGTVGEIWMRGPSIAQGYWQAEEATADTFGLKVSDGSGPYMRTGDVGFMKDGDVYITGRSKEVIIIRGANHYPQDIEQTVECAHPHVKPGCIAAFALDDGEEERLGLVTEVTETGDGLDPDAVMEAIRRAVAANHQVEVSAIALLEPKSMPKTSSGKIQRIGSREGFVEGSLSEVARFVRGAA